MRMDLGFHRRAVALLKVNGELARGDAAEPIAAYRTLLAVNAARSAASPTVRASYADADVGQLGFDEARIGLFAGENCACQGAFAAIDGDLTGFVNVPFTKLL